MKIVQPILISKFVKDVLQRKTFTALKTREALIKNPQALSRVKIRFLYTGK